MRFLVVFVTALFTPLFLSAAKAQAPTDHAGLFDQFEGVWRLNTYFEGDDGSVTERIAELRVTRLESEQAPVFLFEERHDGQANNGLFIGRVLYAYHQDANAWRGAGVNTLANRKWRDVRVDGDEIVFLETGELFGGRSGKNRFTYYNITDSSFELRGEATEDGETWTPSRYRFTAERVATSAG